MNPRYMEYLENRLYEWADWYLHGNSYGLGYPRCSIELRILLEGCIQRNPGPKPIPTNESAEEIEELVKQMAKYNVNMAKALRCQYFITGTLRTKAARLQMSHSHFKHCVEMGHQWLAGRLSAKKQL